MISCGDTCEFVPFGREYIQIHPGKVGLPSQKSFSNVQSELAEQLETVSLSASKDSWHIRKSTDGLTEEELYISGNTVVWSHGIMGQEGSRKVIKSMTCDSPVEQALFATFYTYPNEPAFMGEAIPDDPTGEAAAAICILEKDCLSVFMESGEYFAVTLPFRVKKIWSIKYGILMEYQMSSNDPLMVFDRERPLPVLYSLLHPLDEINPVLQKLGTAGAPELDYASDEHIQLIFTSIQPSVCVTYNMKSNLICVWKVRRAKQEENSTILQNSLQSRNLDTPSSCVFSKAHSSASYSLSQSHLGSPNVGAMSVTHTSTYVHTSMQFLQSGHAGTPKLMQTPQSLITSLSHFQSPLYGAHYLRLGMSPSSSHSSFPRTPLVASAANNSANNSTLETEPLIPDVCLELIWSESSCSLPVSGFLSEDFVNQKFLCVMLPQVNCIKCIKYEYANNKTSLVFGKVSSISGKDAQPLVGLKMIIVVDVSNSLILYSGLHRLCRVHVSGVPSLNMSLFKDFSSLNISSRLYSPIATPQRRSSLLVSSRPTSSLDAKFDVGLSPVSTEKSVDNSFLEDPLLPLSSAVTAVHDATDYKITLENGSHSYYRVTLPEIWTSTLVGDAVASIKHILPREVAVQLLSRWYSTRNAPGTGDLSPSSEWLLFSMTVLGMMGYNPDRLARCPVDTSSSASPMVASKKFRVSENGSVSDWEYLMASSYHQTAGNSISELLGLEKVGYVAPLTEDVETLFNTSGALFNYVPCIFFVLHLLYEEFKLSCLLWDNCILMLPCLTQLAADLKLEYYLDHYWRDFPNLCSCHGPSTHMSLQDISKLSYPGYFSSSPPHIFRHLINLLENNSDIEPFPYIPDVSKLTQKVVSVYAVAGKNFDLDAISVEKILRRVSPTGHKTPYVPATNQLLLGSKAILTSASSSSNLHEKIVLLTQQSGISNSDMQLFAPGVSLLMINSQHMCRANPPSEWPSSAYKLIRRSDLVNQREQAENDPFFKSESSKFRTKARKIEDKREETMALGESLKKAKEPDNGMETLDWELLNLRWSEDQRVLEVMRMLNSSQAATINITQRPEVSDHEFLQEQEKYLYTLCIRTMALPIGRGMFTFCTYSPIITEPLPIPILNLTGKAPPRGTTIDLSNIEVPTNMNMWPLFHNGVAAGLKIAPNCSEVDSTWIVYNKPKEGTDFSNEHAGFLMALGLNGHLRNLATVSMHDYLTQGNELTCVGILLGISAAKRGTMDSQITKLLSIHLECLLPPTSIELDVPHAVQVAALMGIGLVYHETGHRPMSEILLQEIGRPPGPEMENSCDRESYSLAAGFSLGLILFGKGRDSSDYVDLNIAGILHHFIEGRHKKPLTGIMKEKYKSPSYQIKEGDKVNTDVTAPGAIIALGMIYFNTGNKAVNDWMVAPNTPYLLDEVRPDFLLLRTIAVGMIMWEDVMPHSKWVEGNIPQTVMMHVRSTGGSQSTPGIDYESMHQVYYNILAGACFVLGLKFAGSANSEAFRILWKYTQLFINYTKRRSAELAGKSTMETCLNVILLSLSMVMAGTGDLDVLRAIRLLRSRVGPSNSSIGYGSHLAVHMALGFIFLGGGRFTLGTSNMSIAALLISCFPKFPTHSNDNRYHLQALRHLYFLAAEPRLLIPADVDSGKLQKVKVLVRFNDTKYYKGMSYEDVAPLMLPELAKLSEVIIEGDIEKHQYWPVRFCKTNVTWDVLRALLHGNNGMAVKLKDGRDAYGDAPSGFRIKMPHFLSNEKLAHWAIETCRLEELFGNSADFIHSLLLTNDDMDLEPNKNFFQPLSAIIFECLSVGKPEIITNWISLYQSINKIASFSQKAGLLIWQVKLLQSVAHYLEKLDSKDTQASSQAHTTTPKPLVSLEQALSLTDRLNILADQWYKDVNAEIFSYFKGETQQYGAKCAFTLILKDLPTHHLLGAVSLDNPLVLYKHLSNAAVPPLTITNITKFVFSFHDRN